MEANGKKNLAIGMLVAAICIMAIGYAALAQTLTINGTAEITGTWDVHLQNVQQTAKSETAKVNTPSISSTVVTFDVELLQPGDYVTYTVDVKNGGTIDAKLKDLTTTLQSVADGGSSQIEWTFSGMAKDDVLAAGQTKTVTLTATYPASEATVTADQSRTMSVVFDFGQNN